MITLQKILLNAFDSVIKENVDKLAFYSDLEDSVSLAQEYQNYYDDFNDYKEDLEENLYSFLADEYGFYNKVMENVLENAPENLFELTAKECDLNINQLAHIISSTNVAMQGEYGYYVGCEKSGLIVLVEYIMTTQVVANVFNSGNINDINMDNIFNTMKNVLLDNNFDLAFKDKIEEDYKVIKEKGYFPTI